MSDHSVYATRSWLFTPATRPDRLLSAARSGVDVSIADLEDSVSSAEKPDARKNLLAWLNTPLDETTPQLAVRINSVSTRFGLDDLAALLDASRMPDFLLLPKTESPHQVALVASLFDQAGKTSVLVPLIESARGMFAVESIASASSHVGALMFGAADYASDVRAQPDSLALQLARCGVAAACASAGIEVIDAPCFAIHDADLLQGDLAFALANGFHGKATIHPSHIESINRAFTPSADRVARAKRVLEANEQGVGIVDGRMVDEAIAREARSVLAAI